MPAAFSLVRFESVGWLTEAEMAEVDRVMIDDIGITLVQMMENAGRSLARVAIEEFAPSTVTVLAGAGGNGGGGLVAARHLANRGVDVSVTLGQDATTLRPVPALQFSVLEQMGVEVAHEPRRSDLLIDSLIGYSLRGAPRGRIAELIADVPSLASRVVSLDTPSGLDVNTGAAPGAVVQADATVTLALPKVGLRLAPQVGRLFLADISVPPSVYGRMGVGPAPDFSASSVLELDASSQPR